MLALQEDNFFGVVGGGGGDVGDHGVDDGDDYVPPVDGEEADLGFLRAAKKTKLGGKRTSTSGKSKKHVKPLYMRKSLKSVLEVEDQDKAPFVPTVDSIAFPDSALPKRKFCCVCGMLSSYTCRKCNQRYCSLNCDEAHRETRCLKFAK